MSEWSDLPHFERLALSANTRDEQLAAARYTAAQAVDADDCRQLLDALGLLPTQPKTKRATPPRPTTTDCPTNTRR
ncbi:hypothetical protein [Streptomyces sp. LUP30]|uniref:hypothetical protein n=1 Tax=Streptomyces sp. LUP30 TaxID=1890285 RepID=UPI0008517002|nr:hypothetical protein [Streptomyces sp. LUP30]